MGPVPCFSTQKQSTISNAPQLINQLLSDNNADMDKLSLFNLIKYKILNTTNVKLLSQYFFLAVFLSTLELSKVKKKVLLYNS